MFHSVGVELDFRLGSLLLERLSSRLWRIKTRLHCLSIPTVSAAVVEPYNSILSSPLLLEPASICCMLDNEAVYDIYPEETLISKTNTPAEQTHPSSHLILAASLRFDGAFQTLISLGQTNLVHIQEYPFHVVILFTNHFSWKETSRTTFSCTESPTVVSNQPTWWPNVTQEPYSKI